ncbi:MAG: ROK family protein [Acidimicrobiia bacterium]
MRIGIDIGGTKTLGVVLDDAGDITTEAIVATPDASRLVDAIAEVVSRLTPALGPIGIGAAGLITADGVMRAAANVSGVSDLPLAALVRERLGVECRVDNDNTCAGLAEWREGAGRGQRDMIYVGLGTGIGGALVCGGALQRGANGFAGEIGHVVIDPEGPLCPCGRRGCWERFASGTALASQARALGLDGDDGAVILAAAAEDGSSPSHRRLIEDFSRWLALGLVNLTNIFDPEQIVLGGGVMDSAAVLLGPTRRWFAELLYAPGLRSHPHLSPARFGSRSAAIGAALLFDL